MGSTRGAYRGHARAGRGTKLRGTRASFVLRRLGSARLLPASLLLAIIISAAVTTALAGFGARALPAATHRRLASVPGTSVQISGQIGAATASADTTAIRSSLRSALGTVPFTLASGRWSDALALPRSHGQTSVPLIQAAVLAGVTAYTELAAGNWPGPGGPGQPIGVALPVTTASMLNLAVGDVLALRDSTTGARVRLRVTGLFRPRDPAAPYWRLSLLGTSGKLVQGTFVTYGPMLVNPAALGRGGLVVGGASWLARIDTARIPPARITALQQRLTAAVSSLEGRQDLGGLQVTTGLPQTLAALASSLVVSRSLLLIGSLELILLALAAVTLAARLLASQREEETALLSARGVARSQLARASLAEATLLAVAGAAAGAVLGIYAADLLLSASGLPAGAGGGPAGILRRSGGGVWWLAAVITVLVIVIMTWPALRPAMPGAARGRRGRQAALAGAARAGLDVALIGLGALAFWELRRYSPVPRLSGGGLGVDPVLAAAPAVALAGIALIPLRLLPAAARLLDRASARGRRLGGALASWQVSRRPQRQGGPVLLVVLAVATGTLALAQHQSWRQSQLDQAAFAAGADVRVDLATPLPLGRAGTIAHAPGVLGAMPVTTFNTGFDVFALDAAAATDTVLLRPDLSALPLTALWNRITPARPGPGLALPGPGLALPGRPARLDLSAMLSPPRGQRLSALQVSLSVQDGWGIVYTVPAGDLPADGRYHHLTAVLSATRGARYPLRLLALSVSYQMPGFPPPPYPGNTARLAAVRAEHQRAAALATLVIRALAVSTSASGGFPAPFAGARALARWHPGAAAADLADPHAHGIAPAVADWRATAGGAALTFAVGAGHLIQMTGLPPLPIPGQLTLVAGSPATPLPAIATSAFFGSAGAHLGDIVPLPVGNLSVPVRLVAEVPAFPTVSRGQPAVIVDQASLAGVLAAKSQPPLPVTQWWLRTGNGAPAGLPPGATTASRARLAAGLLDDPLPNVPQLGLLVIVAAAALVACIGFAVSVVATVRERRLQDALLAALGVGPAARAGQLCLEQLMLSLPAAAAGAVIGAVLAGLLVPAVTLTGGAAAPFPPVSVVIPLGQLALLALAVAAVPVLAAAATAAYHPDPAAQLRAGESE
jgi:hypothetical protein